jgi:hypothetical protein
MTFWDASAIVPLLVTETTTARLQVLAQRDPDMLAWWGSTVECGGHVGRTPGGCDAEGGVRIDRHCAGLTQPHQRTRRQPCDQLHSC